MEWIALVRGRSGQGLSWSVRWKKSERQQTGGRGPDCDPSKCKATGSMAQGASCTPSQRLPQQHLGQASVRLKALRSHGQFGALWGRGRLSEQQMLLSSVLEFSGFPLATDLL